MLTEWPIVSNLGGLVHVLRGLPIAAFARGRIRQTIGRKRSTLPQEGEPIPPQASPESVERGLAPATIRPRRASHDGGELSKGSGAAGELIRRLVDLGIVPRRDGERPFVPGDVHRVRLAPAFERSGIPRTGAGRSMLGSEPQASRRWALVNGCRDLLTRLS
jgi:hypothetical protein